MAQGRSPAAKGPLDGRMATSLRDLTDRIRSLENRIILSTRSWRIEDDATGELTAFNPTTGVTTILAPETDVASVLAATSSANGGLDASAWFGDARDGDHVVSGIETMTRSRAYRNLTVPAGCELKVQGYILSVASVLDGNGLITANGSDAIGTAGGIQINPGCVKGNRGGNAGSIGSGQGVASGGHGGAGTSPGAAGGAAYVGAGDFAFGLGIAGDIVYYVAEYNDAGSGGGGGGPDVAAPADGGGGGGGATGIWLAARKWNFTGKVQCNGGKGADGQPGGDTGGGGGGSGGQLIIIYGTDSPQVPDAECKGGLPGAGNGAGTSGKPGDPGTLHVYGWSTEAGGSNGIISSGDSEHNGTGAESTQVGTSAIASADSGTAVGDGSQAIGSDYGQTAVGWHAVSDSKQGSAFGAAAAASGIESVAIGADSAVNYGADHGVAVGGGAIMEATQGVTVGYGSYVRSDAIAGVAVGNEATCLAPDTVALGNGARATHIRCVALGAGAACGADDEGVVQVDQFEVVPSSGGLESALVLSDSAGARWKITVDTTGHLTTTAL